MAVRYIGVAWYLFVVSRAHGKDLVAESKDLTVTTAVVSRMHLRWLFLPRIPVASLWRNLL